MTSIEVPRPRHQKTISKEVSVKTINEDSKRNKNGNESTIKKALRKLVTAAIRRKNSNTVLHHLVRQRKLIMWLTGYQLPDPVRITLPAIRMPLKLYLRVVPVLLHRKWPKCRRNRHLQNHHPRRRICIVWNWRLKILEALQVRHQVSKVPKSVEALKKLRFHAKSNFVFQSCQVFSSIFENLFTFFSCLFAIFQKKLTLLKHSIGSEM